MVSIVSVLFVSRSLLGRAEQPCEFDAIVATTMRNNGWLKLSGALVSSGDWFAQLIEGPEESVDLMVDRIAADPRHTGMRVVCRTRRHERRLPAWRVAYSGQSRFVESAIESVVEAIADPAEHQARVSRLLAIVTGLGRVPE